MSRDNWHSWQHHVGRDFDMVHCAVDLMCLRCLGPGPSWLTVNVFLTVKEGPWAVLSIERRLTYLETFMWSSAWIICHSFWSCLLALQSDDNWNYQTLQGCDCALLSYTLYIMSRYTWLCNEWFHLNQVPMLNNYTIYMLIIVWASNNCVWLYIACHGTPYSMPSFG